MKRTRSIFLLLLTFMLIFTGCIPRQEQQNIPDRAKYKNADLPIEERINDLFSYMTLEEKVAQMAQVANYAASPSDVTDKGLGSILSGGSDGPYSGFKPENWLEFCNEYQKAALESRLGIPILYGIDAVHGHAKAVGATVFPHNIGLGAANDPGLMEKIGRITAVEVSASGINWNFSPCVAVARDIRWGRTYESFGETPDIVSPLGAAYIRGLQAGGLGKRDSVAACVKHYFGDGAAEWGTGIDGGIDQGDSKATDEEMRTIHLAPYIEAVKQNPATIMISFSGIRGEEMHGNKKWIDILRNELGFDGLIVSDWAGHKQLNGSNILAQSINAGIDMIMIPDTFDSFILEVSQNVRDGIISEERINEAVRRILKLKFEMGLFENPLADGTLLSSVGTDESMKTAREAVRKSLVLLKNNKNALPLSEDDPVAVIGTKSKDMGVMCGGWTVYWGGYSMHEKLRGWLDDNSQKIKAQNMFVKGTTILDSLTERLGEDKISYSDNGENTGPAKKSIVVIGEVPYVEFTGDSNDLGISEEDVARVKNARSKGTQVIAVIISGRPLIITEIEPYCDAIVAAWLPGSMAGPGITDALYGDHDFTGKLSFTWPRSMKDIPFKESTKGMYPRGYGLQMKSE
ncbi:MAG: glycoside hydrolase family 3 protein [Spirochaetes bacterium]|nr:glycoside hydrolase family 3 protein [Spirochaetota bacterium]MBN2770221.1 glycoside hydrolase family 3 protein [Spirochaetota bacterium]